MSDFCLTQIEQFYSYLTCIYHDENKLHFDEMMCVLH